LNHFRTNTRIAETAFEVISRWRATSISSLVGGVAFVSANDQLNLYRFIDGRDIRGCSVVGDMIGRGACILPPGAPGPVTVAKRSLRRTITQLCMIGRVCFYHQRPAEDNTEATYIDDIDPV